MSEIPTAHFDKDHFMNPHNVPPTTMPERIFAVKFPDGEILADEVCDGNDTSYTRTDIHNQTKGVLRECVEALRTISEGKGAYRQGPLEHAKNVINEAIETAKQALTKAEKLI